MIWVWEIPWRGLFFVSFLDSVMLMVSLVRNLRIICVQRAQFFLFDGCYHHQYQYGSSSGIDRVIQFIVSFRAGPLRLFYGKLKRSGFFLFFLADERRVRVSNE